MLWCKECRDQGCVGAQTFMPQKVADASATSACTDAVLSAHIPFICTSELVLALWEACTVVLDNVTLRKL